jgi:hypothetical protein
MNYETNVPLSFVFYVFSDDNSRSIRMLSRRVYVLRVACRSLLLSRKQCLFLAVIVEESRAGKLHARRRALGIYLNIYIFLRAGLTLGSERMGTGKCLPMSS